MKMRVLIYVLLSALPLILSFVWLREVLAVDAALDGGASWNYVTGQADYSLNHPYISFHSRHPILIAASLASLFAGLIFGFGIHRKDTEGDISNVPT